MVAVSLKKKKKKKKKKKNIIFFFFKQKTAYEMCDSDWSSDVCSSDLLGVVAAHPAGFVPLGAVHPEDVEKRTLIEIWKGCPGSPTPTARAVPGWPQARVSVHIPAHEAARAFPAGLLDSERKRLRRRPCGSSHRGAQARQGGKSPLARRRQLFPDQ